MIEKITAAVIAVMRTADFISTSVITISAATINSLVFKIEEIDYFDFKLDIWYDEEDIVTVEKNSYTCNVHFFVSYIKNAAIMKETDQVKIQLSEILKKITLK